MLVLGQLFLVSVVAREEAKRILKEHQPEPLDRDIEEELKKIVKEVEKRELKKSSALK